MRRYPSTVKIRGCISLLFLMLLLCGTIAHAEEVLLLDGRCAVSAPEGWRVDRSYGDAGLVMYPPDELAWPVEIAIWDTPKGAASTPRAAALAHEAAIRRNYAYTRRDAKDFATISGLQGLLVTGELELPDKSALAVVFVAYAASERYFAVGTFCLPGQLDDTLSRYLNPIAQNFSIGALQEKPQMPPTVAPATIVAVKPQHDGQAASNATDVATNSGKPEISKPAAITIEPAPKPLMPPAVAPATIVAVKPQYDGQAASNATDVATNSGKPEISKPAAVMSEPAPKPQMPPTMAPATVVAVKPQDDGQADTHQNGPEAAKFAPLGSGALNIQAPPGFVIEESDGKWLAHPALMDRLSMGIAVWPLVTDGTATAEEVARGILSGWDVSAKAAMKYRITEDSTFFAGRGNTVGGKYRVIGSCTVQGNSALLRAAYVLDNHATTEWLTLATMLASVQTSPISVRTESTDPTIEMWQMPEYPALRFPVPVGWRTRGQVQEYDGLWALTIEALDPGPSRRYISWRQPIIPLFRELTTLLQGLGYKKFDRYTPETGSPAMLFSRVGPMEFVENYYNQHTRTPLSNVRTVEATDSEHVRRLVNASDSTGTHIVCEGESVLGPRRNTYLVASGNAVQTGLHNWQTAVLEASAPADDNGMAVAALRAMVEGIQIDKTQGDVPFGLADLIRRATEAVSVLPSITLPKPPATGSALTLATNEGTGKWNAPDNAGVQWEKAISAFGTEKTPAEILPELNTLCY